METLKNTPDTAGTRFIVLTMVLAAAIFVLDLFTPLGLAVWVFYEALVLLSLWSPYPRYAFFLAATCTALVILGFFYPVPVRSPQLVLLNRSFGVAVMWTTAALCFLRQRADQALRTAQDDLKARARQQAVVVELGQRALAATNLLTLMNEAVGLVAQTLGVEYGEVLELLPDGEVFRLEAGVGWTEGCVGHATVNAWTKSQAGYTLLSNEPVIVDDLRTEGRLSGSPLLHDHGVVSGMSVAIHVLGRPFGVLGVHSARRRTFTQDDIHFLQAVANVLATAIERKRAEEEVREMNVALANAMPGISRLDAEGRYVNVNEIYARMIGYEPGEMIGLDWTPTVHPEDRENAIAAYHRMVNEGKAEFEARAVRKDGSMFHKHVLMVKRVDKEGSFIGHDCFMRDISERKWAEATRRALYQASLTIQEPLGLQERLDRLLHTAQTVLELDRVNILLADPEERELQAVASLGVEEPLEAIRVPIGPAGGALVEAYHTQQMIVWDGHAPLPEPLRLKPPYDQIKGLRSRGFANVPLVVQGRAIGVLGADRRRTRRPLDAATLELLQLFAAQAALAIERARLYEAQRTAALQLEARVEARTQELQATNLRLEDATRMKWKFLADMSHELRSPLNSILGFAGDLQDQTLAHLTAKQASYVDNIHKKGQHLLTLINDLLDFSKVEAEEIRLRPEALELREALAAVLTEIRPQATAKRLQLQLQVDEALSTITADPVRFKQIVFNLLDNAVKFTPEGGAVTVTARRGSRGEGRRSAEDSHPDARRAAVARRECVEIAVQDTGIGIAAEDLPKLGQSFTQLESPFTKQRQGTGGVGLALTKRLVDLHRGEFRMDSEGVGRGSTFTVRLPLVRQAPRS